MRVHRRARAGPHADRPAPRLREERLKRLLLLALLLSACSSTSTPAPAPASQWHPRAGLSWQWQLTGTLDLKVPVSVYDVDLFTATTAQVAQLHRAGRKVICYLDVGTYEPYRPDSKDFPAAVIGKALPDFPDERWLDVRRTNVLLPLLAKRFDLCKAKGFDAVEPDNVDAYANSSGFPLTASEQLAFNRGIASLAHQRGLAVGLKNDLDQVSALQPSFDFAVNEQCFEYDECDLLKPFITADKPVLQVEYDLTAKQFCSRARALRFSSLEKHVALDAYRVAC